MSELNENINVEDTMLFCSNTTPRKTTPTKTPSSALSERVSRARKQLEEAEAELKAEAELIASLSSTLLSSDDMNQNSSPSSPTFGTFTSTTTPQHLKPLLDAKTETFLIETGKTLLTPFNACLKASVESIKAYKTDNINILAFIAGVNNILATSSIPSELWVKIVLSYLTNSPMSIHFIEFNTLKSVVQHNSWSPKRILYPLDVAAWSFNDFANQLFLLFRDEKFLHNTTAILSSWNFATCTDIKAAFSAFETLMSHSSLYHTFSDANSPLSFDYLCEVNKSWIWRTLNPTFLRKFSAMCLHLTGRTPLDAMLDSPYPLLKKAILEFTKFNFDLSTMEKKDKNISIISTSDTTQDRIINAISSSNTKPLLKCDFCKKPNHSHENCFRKHPELKLKWVCQICRETGHTPQDCPNNHV